MRAWSRGWGRGRPWWPGQPWGGDMRPHTRATRSGRGRGRLPGASGGTRPCRCLGAGHLSSEPGGRTPPPGAAQPWPPTAAAQESSVRGPSESCLPCPGRGSCCPSHGAFPMTWSRQAQSVPSVTGRGLGGRRPSVPRRGPCDGSLLAGVWVGSSVGMSLRVASAAPEQIPGGDGWWHVASAHTSREQLSVAKVSARGTPPRCAGPAGARGALGAAGVPGGPAVATCASAPQETPPRPCPRWCPPSAYGAVSATASSGRGLGPQSIRYLKTQKLSLG